jgi:hypothetical protein
LIDFVILKDVLVMNVVKYRTFSALYGFLDDEGIRSTDVIGSDSSEVSSGVSELVSELKSSSVGSSSTEVVSEIVFSSSGSEICSGSEVCNDAF